MRERELRRFLLAFFFYIDGVLTAIYMSSTLASTTFGFTQNELIYLYLGIQIAALAGAFALARPTDRLGPKKVVSGVLVLWITVAVGIYFVESKRSPRSRCRRASAWARSRPRAERSWRA
jgi:UMF1 family MFS transporter